MLASTALDFRALKSVRTLVGQFGFAERETRGGRWSYTINFVKHEPVVERHGALGSATGT
jgi:hypothetical protein